MKSMKGRFLKKLKSIRPATSLKAERVLHVNASDGFLDSFIPHSDNGVFQNAVMCKVQDDKVNQINLSKLEPEIIDIAELMKDLEEAEEMESEEDDVGNKENIALSVKPTYMFSLKQSRNPEASVILPESASCHLRNGPLSELDVSSLRQPDVPPVDHDPQIRESSLSVIRPGPLSEIKISSFRQPDLNPGSLFDPNLLATSEQGVMNNIRAHEAERKARATVSMDTKERKAEPEPEAESQSKSCLVKDEFLEFEEKCPPGGSEKVILYTTSLRGIRKTFEDCNTMRFLLKSFRVSFYERDVSMHMEFREELWRILGGRVVPPKLFIKGRYIGGTEDVMSLHEQGKLKLLLQGFPADQTDSRCDGCAGIRFVLCSNCSGSRKIIPEMEDEEDLPIRCLECNENGLIVCPICC